MTNIIRLDVHRIRRQIEHGGNLARAEDMEEIRMDTALVLIDKLLIETLHTDRNSVALTNEEYREKFNQLRMKYAAAFCTTKFAAIVMI